MVVEIGQPVLLTLDSGPKVHLPAPTATEGPARRGSGVAVRVRAFDPEWPPPRWPTLCGLEGTTWVYDGVVRDRGRRVGFCLVCVAKARAAASRRQATRRNV